MLPYTLLTPTTTFLKGNLVAKMGEVGVSRVYLHFPFEAALTERIESFKQNAFNKKDRNSQQKGYTPYSHLLPPFSLLNYL